MKELFKKLISVWSTFFLFPLKLMRKFYGEKIIEEIMIQFCRTIEKGTGLFVSHRLRPVNPETEFELPEISSSDSIALILQGPVVHEKNFTVNTVRFYKKMSGNIQIIVSTWDTETKETVRELESAGAVVILSSMPEYGGIGNINYQLLSMQAGIKKALELEADYICKLRTDQRVEHPYAFSFMKDLLKQYPVMGDSVLNYRIIALATEYGSMFEPYYISDFLYFGYKKDMEKMLYIPFNDRKFIDRINMTRKMLAEQKGTAEIYIIKSFFEICGEHCEDSVLGYWTLLKNSMILIDKPLIRLFWPKYDARYCEHIRDGSYSVRMDPKRNGLSNFDFLSWQCLTDGKLMYKKEYESFMEMYL